MTPETQKLIDRSNELHAAFQEKKNLQSAWLDRNHTAAKKMSEANKALWSALNQKEDPEALLINWYVAYDLCEEISKETMPPPPDGQEWRFAQQDAIEAIAIEVGLRLRAD